MGKLTIDENIFLNDGKNTVLISRLMPKSKLLLPKKKTRQQKQTRGKAL